jgi:hypothetical protein
MTTQFQALELKRHVWFRLRSEYKTAEISLGKKD